MKISLNRGKKKYNRETWNNVFDDRNDKNLQICIIAE